MIPALEFFATNEAVELLEAALKAARGIGRAPALMAVAWQMRQRDTPRALALADELQVILDARIPLPDNEERRMQARLMLIRGEVKCLSGELDAGAVLAGQALQDFAACFDAIGCADAHWLQHLIAGGQGDVVRQDAELKSVAAAAQGGDPVRVTMADAALATRAVYRDVAAARQEWSAQFSFEADAMHPAAASWVNGFFAAIAGVSGEHVESIRHYGTTYTQALATGQVRRAIVAATNLGVGFNDLNDHHAALEWMQRGMDLARPRAWSGTMGVALLQTAGTLRELRRFDAARELLCEAMVLMAPMAASRNYAVALRYLADVDLSCCHYAEALASFQLLERRADALKAADLLCNALRGQAQALLKLAQPQAALAKAHAALAVAQPLAIEQIDALRAIAEIHAQHALPAPPGMRAASAALHYLQLAHDVATNITDYIVPGDLLEALASEHAKIGNHVQAYELALQAILAHDTIRSTEAGNRASAMQVKHETERARAESEHHRQLARAHAERADVLEQANRAYQSVLENAQDAIVLTDREGCIKNWNRQAVLTFGWTLEDARGRDIAAMVFPARFHATVAATLSRQRQVLQDAPRAEMIAVRRDGSEFPIELSLTSVNVWGQSECSFFIRDITQRRKAELEITESLDKQLELADIKSRFVSMASHEFRTPLTLILSASDLLKSFGPRMGEQERAECHDSIKHAVKRMTDMLEDVLLIGESDAGEAQFKPIPFDLRRLCESIVNEVGLRHGQSARAPHPIELRVPGGLFKVDLDERWFRHIFCNLLSNAIKYSPDGGVVVFQVAQVAEGIEFLVIDKGIGLPKEDIPRIFESFFRASNIGNIGGTGLGLSIAKRAVELHGGHISVSSELGLGTTFKVVLPAVAVR